MEDEVDGKKVIDDGRTVWLDSGETVGFPSDAIASDLFEFGPLLSSELAGVIHPGQPAPGDSVQAGAVILCCEVRRLQF